MGRVFHNWATELLENTEVEPNALRMRSTMIMKSECQIFYFHLL